jgi:hypothetical protein
MGDNTRGAEHIYRQWVDVFESSGVPYFALFRHQQMFDLARNERPNAAMAFARTASAVGDVVNSQPTLRAAFYSGNPGNISHMMPYHDFAHVFIGHGDSDKSTSASRMFRLYDEIWVAGQAHVDRLEGVIPADVEIRVVGRPQVASAVGRNASRKSEKKTLVFAYLPTWEGPRDDIDYSSVGIAEEIAREILGVGGEVKAKFHPSTGARVTDFRRIETLLAKTSTFVASANELVDRTYSAPMLMESCDYCVTDVSSIISDWVIRDRPIFVFKPIQAKVTQSRFPIDTYCYTFSSISELRTELARVVQNGDDYKREARRLAANYIVSPEATIKGEFTRVLRSLCLNEVPDRRSKGAIYPIKRV